MAFSPIKNWIKYIAVILMFSTLYTSWYYGESLIGYPDQKSVPSKFELIWGREVHHDNIELWIIDDTNDHLSNQSRLYILPWNQQLSDQLAQALKSLAQGIPVFMGSETKGENGKNPGGGFGPFGSGKHTVAQIFNGVNSSGSELKIERNLPDSPSK